ncbi:protein EARLY STARVATION 1, chloroplastic isoform X1 [Cornus florida]|uniref:protein EARLY STARVATION 1, chloroplastic isoform X1 n=1 Tax=Cornus florida TaxID=4283 RepID=UPI00289ED22E|nr:protein EARLY STARVATION 1, chloroplastic isoform X1 [Cornus florida]
MAASSRGLSTPFSLKLRRVDVTPLHHQRLELKKRKRRFGAIRCCSDSLAPIRRTTGSGKSPDKVEEWPFDSKKIPRRVRIQATPALPFASSQSRFVSKQEKFYPRCTPRNSGPQSRDTPPKRDTGIANEKDWGISLLNENVVESGTNEDGSSWYRESGEDLGENGYRCRWTRMGGQWHDGSSEWKETWWEKSDWTGYKELGVEKSGRNAEGDSWWETWQEVLHQDEWSNLARIERSAQKQAKSGTENAGWYEKWWEKYDAKGWTEKGAHKYGRLNEQSWWEKWGEHYDGRGSVLKWTDKWAETELGTKWGDKWEEKFFAGIGSRQGETWHVSPSGDRWSRTWGEEHFGNGYATNFCKVHKYGKSTTGESWDIVVDEETYYEADPHYGWADVVGDSSQLLSIKPPERPPGFYPNLEFGSSPPPPDDMPSHPPPAPPPPSQ